MVKTTEIINFGQTKTSLQNVGYRIYNPDGTPYNERQVESALNLGGGSYSVNIDVPAEKWEGLIQWDSNDTNPIYLVGSFNGIIINILQRLIRIEEKLDNVCDKLPSGFMMGSSDDTNKDDEIDDILSSGVMTG